MTSVVGNQAVLDMLDRVREIALEKGMNHIAISLVGYPNEAALASCGDVMLEKAQQEAVGKLLQRVNRSIENWSLPKRDETLAEDHAVYNLAGGPLGFDFLVWLVDAEMRRIKAGAPAPLKVGFWIGKDPKTDVNFDLRQTWLNKVFRPSLGLLGAVEDERAIRGHYRGQFTTNSIVRAMKAGATVPQFVSPVAHRYEPGYITITLREARHWPHRNSDLAVWLKFAAELRDKGERVVFIRDTAMADQPLGGFETDPLAAYDLHARAGRYERAKANLFVANGPATLCVFGAAPWLMFVPLEDASSGYRPNTGKFWRIDQGVAPGRQYPWATKAQRLVWESATYPSLCKAWEELRPHLA